MMNRVEMAASRFGEGYNCAQAVLAAFSNTLGLDTEAALKLAAPFGGGMARTAETCGAVTGALMVLGLRHAQAGPSQDAKEAAYRAAGEFFARFRERHCTLRCKELLGSDLSTPEGMQVARESGAFRTVCPALVRSAAEVVEGLL